MGRFCSHISLDFDLPAMKEDPALYVRCVHLLAELQWRLYKYNPNCHDRDKFMRDLDGVYASALRLLTGPPPSDDDDDEGLPF